MDPGSHHLLLADATIINLSALANLFLTPSAHPARKQYWFFFFFFYGGYFYCCLRDLHFTFGGGAITILSSFTH